jgi:flavodoxin
MAQSRTLVVYFSRSGTTRKVAEAIAKELSGEIEEIIDRTSRQGLLGYWRSLLEAQRGAPAGIVDGQKAPSSYDLVVIGTPVWAWSMSSPVRAYLMAHKASFKELAFFCTMGGQGGDRALRQMQDLSGKVPRAVLAVTAHDVATNSYSHSLAKFVQAARSPLSGPQQPTLVGKAA